MEFEWHSHLTGSAPFFWTRISQGRRLIVSQRGSDVRLEMVGGAGPGFWSQPVKDWPDETLSESHKTRSIAFLRTKGLIG